MMVASAQITNFFHQLGWQMQVCSQGTVAVRGNAQSREQQILFRPGASTIGHVEPHIFLELYTGEGKPELYAKEHLTQVLANQFLRIKQVGNCQSAVQQLGDFINEYLAGQEEDDSEEFQSYAVDVFLSRGETGITWVVGRCASVISWLIDLDGASSSATSATWVQVDSFGSSSLFFATMASGEKYHP
jgi:hypothetical protein